MPIAAAWLAAYNFNAYGEPRKARQVKLWGALASLAVFVLAAILPDQVPNSSGALDKRA